MTDFDRYKVMKAKRMVSVSRALPLNSCRSQNMTNHVFFSSFLQRNKIIKHEVKKLQKEAAKKWTITK